MQLHTSFGHFGVFRTQRVYKSEECTIYNFCLSQNHQQRWGRTISVNFLPISIHIDQNVIKKRGKYKKMN